LTSQQQKLVATATAELRKVNADPADVWAEWALLRERFDNPTPAALAKHWGTNGTGPKTTDNRRPARGTGTLAAAQQLVQRYEQSGHAGDGPLAIDRGPF